MLNSLTRITGRQLVFILKNTTLFRLITALISFDYFRIKVLKALGKTGIINFFADCIAHDFKFYESYVGRGLEVTYLDIGCGSGNTAFYIHEKTGVKTICLDVTDKAFNPKLKQRLNHNFSFMQYQMGTTLPFESQSINIATMHYVLHHCDYGSGARRQALELLKEARRVIKNGGTLVLLEEPLKNERERGAKDRMDDFANKLFNAGAVEKSYFYYDSELKTQFKEAGFSDEDIKEIKINEWSWLMPRTLYILTVKHSSYSTHNNSHQIIDE